MAEAHWHSDLYGQITQPEQQTETDLRFWTQLFSTGSLNSWVQKRRSVSVCCSGCVIWPYRSECQSFSHAISPDYQEPDVAWLNDWAFDLYGQIQRTEQQTETDLRFWTQLFNEPA